MQTKSLSRVRKQNKRVTRNPKIVGDKVTAKSPAALLAWRVSGPTLSRCSPWIKWTLFLGKIKESRRYSNLPPKQTQPGKGREV